MQKKQPALSHQTLVDLVSIIDAAVVVADRLDDIRAAWKKKRDVRRLFDGESSLALLSVCNVLRIPVISVAERPHPRFVAAIVFVNLVRREIKGEGTLLSDFDGKSAREFARSPVGKKLIGGHGAHVPRYPRQFLDILRTCVANAESRLNESVNESEIDAFTAFADSMPSGGPKSAKRKATVKKGKREADDDEDEDEEQNGTEQAPQPKRRRRLAKRSKGSSKPDPSKTDTVTATAAAAAGV